MSCYQWYTYLLPACLWFINICLAVPGHKVHVGATQTSREGSSFGMKEGQLRVLTLQHMAVSPLQKLLNECLQLQSLKKWFWSCDLPAVRDPRMFKADCRCSGRILRHRKTGLFRCEQMPASCGKRSFIRSLGYRANEQLYEERNAFDDLIISIEGKKEYNVSFFTNITRVQAPLVDDFLTNYFHEGVPGIFIGRNAQACSSVHAIDWSHAIRSFRKANILHNSSSYLQTHLGQLLEEKIHARTKFDLRPWHVPSTQLVKDTHDLSQRLQQN